MREPRIETILFDLDGTLIDTEPCAVLALEERFREWKIPLVPEDAHYVTGRTWAAAFDHLFARYPLPIARERAESEILASYQRLTRTNLLSVPGGADAVRALSAEFPLGLVSGSHREDILWSLDHLGILDRFQIILGAEDYPQSKPEPDGYLKALAALGLDPDVSLVFEDSAAGILSARRAGSWVVGIRATNHLGQDTSSAHLHVENLVGVDPSWIRTVVLPHLRLLASSK